jgi:hypothetical protein
MSVEKTYSSHAACLPRRSGAKAGVLDCGGYDAAFPSLHACSASLHALRLRKRKKMQNEPNLKIVQIIANKTLMQKFENLLLKNEPNFTPSNMVERAYPPVFAIFHCAFFKPNQGCSRQFKTPGGEGFLSRKTSLT